METKLEMIRLEFDKVPWGTEGGTQLSCGAQSFPE